MINYIKEEVKHIEYKGVYVSDKVNDAPTEPELYCRNCGTGLRDMIEQRNAKYCHKCGLDLVGNRKPSFPRPPIGGSRSCLN